MKKHLFLLGCLVAMTSSLWAYDFSAVCTTGQTLYYNINKDGETVSITYENDDDDEAATAYNVAPTGDLTIPATVINDGTTYTVVSIGNYAFADCSELTSVSLPNSITTIGEDAFRKCTGLTTMTIPNSVTEIWEGAFEDCSGLTSVSLPNQLDEIDWYTFSGCSALTSIDIPATVTYIGDEAFFGCTNLTEITLPAGLLDLGADVFEETGWMANQQNGLLYLSNWCLGIKGDNIAEVTIKEGTVGIAEEAFSGNDFITTLSLPNTLKYIMYEAFSGCTALTSLIIPSSVLYIDAFAFEECGLTEITNNSNTLVYVGTDVFYDTPWLENQQDTIIYVGNACISANKHFTGEVSIKEGTTVLGDYAFYKQSDMTSIVLPNSLLGISDMVFDACTSLQSITIPASVVRIGDYAFFKCTGLESITCEAIVPPTIFENTFYYEGDYSNAEYSAYDALLLVPAESIQAYKDHAIWGNFTNIKAIGSDAVTETAATAATIFGNNNSIVVKNAENAIVEVFDTMGRTIVTKQRIGSNNEAFAVPQRGIYVVRVNNTSKKLFVK